jgi:hypothetical protein
MYTRTGILLFAAILDAAEIDYRRLAKRKEGKE